MKINKTIFPVQQITINKHPINYLVMALLSAFFIFGCAKDESDPIDNPPPNSTNEDFRWTINGGTLVVSDSAVCYEQFTTIYAYKNGLLSTIEINLSALQPGEYIISSISGNELIYTDHSSTFNASSGTITISGSNSSNISGNFNCVFTGGSINNISGQFSNIPKY